MPDNPKMVYQFQSGYEVPSKVWRPTQCDSCKKPTTNVKPAHNMLGIRHFMCPDCMKRYVAYMNDFYWKGLSIQDGASNGVLAILHLHDDDPRYTAKAKRAPIPRTCRQKIQKMLREIELAKVMGMATT
jgi:hypothetical protein